MREHLIMVINEKFQKVPKISLVENRVFSRGALVFWTQNAIALWANFGGVFSHREEGYCVVRLLTAQKMMFRVPSGNTVKTDVSWCVTKKSKESKKTVLGNCTGLWSLRNLPPAPQGSEAGDQTWGNFKNTAQNLGFLRFRPHRFSTFPSFFSKKTITFGTFELEIFFFNMSR